jgi:5-methylcytosine-specific restriction endonuclease McrA
MTARFDLSMLGRRAAITESQRRELNDLAKEICMLRAGAARVEEQKGRRLEVRWYGNCLWCGFEGWLQWSHIEPVGEHPRLRWDPDNALALCKRCHLFRWHKHPRQAEALAVRILGARRRLALALRAQCPPRPQYFTTRMHLIAERDRILKGGTR